jgi:hypothetical protein
MQRCAAQIPSVPALVTIVCCGVLRIITTPVPRCQQGLDSRLGPTMMVSARLPGQLSDFASSDGCAPGVVYCAMHIAMHQTVIAPIVPVRLAAVLRLLRLP